MVAVPGDIPVTNPLASTVATEVLAELQVPPGVALVSELVSDWQRESVPVIAAGPEFTVTVADVIHPPGSV